jgi:DNA-binding MarR family transcriptional regulator
MLDSLRKSLIAVITREQTNDLTVRQLCILICLSDGPRTVRDIAGETQLAKPSISRAGDRLEELGFAQRQDDPDDRRSVLLVLTSAGKRFLNTIAKP